MAQAKTLTPQDIDRVLVQEQINQCRDSRQDTIGSTPQVRASCFTTSQLDPLMLDHAALPCAFNRLPAAFGFLIVNGSQRIELGGTKFGAQIQ